MARGEDDEPQKKVSHIVGQSLDTLAVDELVERIALLDGEILRLKAEMAKKAAVKSAADALFKF